MWKACSDRSGSRDARGRAAKVGLTAFKPPSNRHVPCCRSTHRVVEATAPDPLPPPWQGSGPRRAAAGDARARRILDAGLAGGAIRVVGAQGQGTARTHDAHVRRWVRVPRGDGRCRCRCSSRRASGSSAGAGESSSSWWWSSRRRFPRDRRWHCCDGSAIENTVRSSPQTAHGEVQRLTALTGGRRRGSAVARRMAHGTAPHGCPARDGHADGGIEASETTVALLAANGTSRKGCARGRRHRVVVTVGAGGMAGGVDVVDDRPEGDEIPPCARVRKAFGAVAALLVDASRTLALDGQDTCGRSQGPWSEARRSRAGYVRRTQRCGTWRSTCPSPGRTCRSPWPPRPGTSPHRRSGRPRCPCRRSR